MKLTKGDAGSLLPDRSRGQVSQGQVGFLDFFGVFVLKMGLREGRLGANERGILWIQGSRLIR